MLQKISQRIKQWLAETVCSQLVIGGHCGCCGRWEPNCIVTYYWRVTICQKCQDEELANIASDEKVGKPKVEK